MANALVLDSLPGEQQEYAAYLKSLGFIVDVGDSRSRAEALLRKREYALVVMDPYLNNSDDGAYLLDVADRAGMRFALVVINDLVEIPSMQQLFACGARQVLTMKAKDFASRKAEIEALVYKSRLRQLEKAKQARLDGCLQRLVETLMDVFAVACVIFLTLAFGWLLEQYFANLYIRTFLALLCGLAVTVLLCKLFGPAVKDAAKVFRAILPKGPPGGG